MIPRVPTTLTLGVFPGGADGFGGDLPLEPELEGPIVLDLSAVQSSPVGAMLSTWRGSTV
jgi:hypothetical protein